MGLLKSAPVILPPPIPTPLCLSPPPVPPPPHLSSHPSRLYNWLVVVVLECQLVIQCALGGHSTSALTSADAEAYCFRVYLQHLELELSSSTTNNKSPRIELQLFLIIGES